MYLEIKDKDKIKDLIKLKKNIFLNCPYHFNNKDLFSVFNCVNCKNPVCISVCKKGAIYYSSKNIISIDQNLCDGCGECIKACPNNAIILRNNKAYKCDLCSNNSFLMPCFYNNKDIFNLKESKDYYNNENNKYLGFTINKNFKIIKNLTRDNKIIDCKDNIKRYLLDLPSLSVQEITIINKILDNYKIKNKFEEKIDDIQLNKDLEDELINYCFENKIELDEDQFKYLLYLMNLNLSNFGPLGLLIDTKEFEEIVFLDVNKPIFVYHVTFGWLETNLIYTSQKIIIDLINKLSWNENKLITLKNPLLNVTIKNNCRLNAVISPVTSTCNFTIRRFTTNSFSVYNLLKSNTISSKALAFIYFALQSDSNIFVAGNTGSGKTTTLNCLLKLIPSTERFVIVEEVKEINIPNIHQTNLLVNEDLDITLEKLIDNTLRMRPDRVIIGETRTRNESLAIVNSLLCGQAKGTYTTFHSQSSREVIQRLLSYGVIENDLCSIDLIIIQRRYNRFNFNKNNQSKIDFKELRTIFEITEVLFEDNKLKLNCVFEYDTLENKLVFKNKSKKIFNKLKIVYGFKDYDDFEKLLVLKEKEFTNNLKNMFFEDL